VSLFKAIPCFVIDSLAAGLDTNKMTFDLSEPHLYFNRELSWLEFNGRVLEEAMDESVPLLERLKFLCIVSSNLDEFFMVRVAGLRQQQSGQMPERTVDGMRPSEVLQAISGRVHDLVSKQYHILKEEIFPRLEQLNIHLINPLQLSTADHQFIEKIFSTDIFPVLTPLVVDSGHPFPRLGNRSLNLALTVTTGDKNNDDSFFAVVQVPSVLQRLVELPRDDLARRYIALENVVAMHAAQLFVGRSVVACHPFRITRNYDLLIDEEEATDLLKTIQKELKRRERGAPVRLEIASDMPSTMVDTLRQAFRLEALDIYSIDGLLNLPDLMPIYNLDGFAEFHDEPHIAVVPAALAEEDVSVFDVIKKGDILIHHPYESFQAVVDFIDEAADDPNVLAIKQTLYRTSADSPIVKALMRGAENGKQVTALVELKARFDESTNIGWAKALEETGVHVVWGLVGLKTHAKIALVVRRESNGIVRYVHLSTGNYHTKTANLYTDLSLLTAREDFGEDASAFFNMLTGYCQPPAFHKFVVSPLYLRRWVLQKIAAEEQAGKEGRIFAQMNALVDPGVIEALYRASMAGVKIELMVRGICCLKPQLAGISENIQVFSVVDRFLEHRRIFNFDAGGKNELYLGSADWMERNLNRRVELLFPIEDPQIKTRILDEIIATSKADTVKMRTLRADGSYQPVVPNGASLRSQKRFIEIVRGQVMAASEAQLPEPRVVTFTPILKAAATV